MEISNKCLQFRIAAQFHLKALRLARVQSAERVEAREFLLLFGNHR